MSIYLFVRVYIFYKILRTPYIVSWKRMVKKNVLQDSLHGIFDAK